MKKLLVLLCVTIMLGTLAVFPSFSAINKTQEPNLAYAAINKTQEPIAYAAINKTQEPIAYAATNELQESGLAYAAINKTQEPNLAYAAINKTQEPIAYAATNELQESGLAYAAQFNSSESVVKPLMDGIIKAVLTEMGLSPSQNLAQSKPVLSEAGNSLADWLIFALARQEYEADYAYYLGVLERYISKNYYREKSLGSVTEWCRLILTVQACGGNVDEIFIDNGSTISLLTDGLLSKDKNALAEQGLNGWIWCLLTLGALEKQDQAILVTKEEMLQELIARQLNDGGFALAGNNIDADMTAMAITALSFYTDDTHKYVNKNEELVTVSAAIEQAVNALSGMQNQDGTFSGFRSAANSASTAWVLVALSTLNMDIMDAAFVKNGCTVLDGLNTFKLASGGYSLTKNTEFNLMASEQVLYALCAYSRSLQNKSGLFAVGKSGDALPSPTFTAQDQKQIEQYVIIKMNTSMCFDASRLYYLVRRAAPYPEWEKHCVYAANTLTLIEKLQKEIAVLRQNIEDLKPIKKLTFIDRERIDRLLRRVEMLSEYDRERIDNLHLLQEANAFVRASQIRFTILLIALILILLIIGFIAVRTSNRRKRKSAKCMRKQQS